MPNTHTQIHIHGIFAVKYRSSVISGSWKEDLYKYITGGCSEEWPPIAVHRRHVRPCPLIVRYASDAITIRFDAGYIWNNSTNMSSPSATLGAGSTGRRKRTPIEYKPSFVLNLNY
jgi:hypothetical protein